jgi:predicted GNAT family N-acyltransferase
MNAQEEGSARKTTVKVGTWKELGEAATTIRFSVFVHEQGVPESEELDALDSVCVHAVIHLGGDAVATGRLCPDGRIGRMAVLKEFRGLGFGEQILRGLIAAASDRGQRETYLHAQIHALGFYSRCGFVAEGPEFEEAGIRHRAMRRMG